MYIDVHAHMDDEILLKDIDNIAKKCRGMDVKAVISNGTNPRSNRIVLELANKYQSVIKAALGIYPIEAGELEGIKTKKEFIEQYDNVFSKNVNALTDVEINDIFRKNFEQYIDQELKFIEENRNKIIAIGEVGIDLHWTKELKFQQYVFEKIIELAKKINKPLMVHSRDAEQFTVNLLTKYNAKKVMIHCFNGSIEVANQILKNGWYFSIPCTIVRNKKVQELVRLIPITKILTETDAPYLAPNPKDTNYPYNVIQSVKKIAELKGLTEKETENIIYMNYQDLFL